VVVRLARLALQGLLPGSPVPVAGYRLTAPTPNVDAHPVPTVSPCGSVKVHRGKA